MYLLLAVVAAVNIVSALLWLRLLFLVRAADEVLSLTTASMYARYLFGQIMTGKWFRAPKTMVLGNPKRDPVIRKVTGSSQYETVEFVASFVKDLPLNVLPYLV
jgi:hypothetical protein